MLTQEEWYLNYLAKQGGLPTKPLYDIAMAISGLHRDHYKGVLGIKTESGGKSSWLRDMEAGVARFAGLMKSFGGDELKATAAYMTSEAKVLSYGESSAWQKHLPGGSE